MAQFQHAVKENEPIASPLSGEQLLKSALFLQEMNAIFLEDLLENINFINAEKVENEVENGQSEDADNLLMGHVAHQMLQSFPVLCVFQCSTRRWVLVDLSDFVLHSHSNTFADLLLLTDDVQPVATHENVQQYVQASLHAVSRDIYRSD